MSAFSVMFVSCLDLFYFFTSRQFSNDIQTREFMTVWGGGV